MKSLKYNWPGIGQLKVRFSGNLNDCKAIVRFNPDLKEISRKAQSTQVSRESSPDIHQSPENR